MSHQSGSTLFSYATLGLKSCITNGSIGEKVYDDEDVHVGWKKSVPKSKRRRNC